MHPRALRTGFALAAFLGAGLFFARQPMSARSYLPLLGGGASVWTAAQLFFLLCLLAGYLLAHLGPRVLGEARYPFAHLALVALGLAAHRADAPTALGPGAPALAIARSLLADDGALVVLLAATSPLLQRWHGRAFPASDPYRLASASNLGSLAALLAYPFALEPRWGLAVQRRAWDACLGLLLALLVPCAVAGARGAPAPEPSRSEGRPWTVRARWVLLPFVTTSVTLGATASITQDLSPVPLLWVLPLALHLGTFAWAFRGDARAPEALFPLAVLVASAVFLTSAAGASSGPAVLALTLLAVGLLGVCLHGRLAQERPPVGALTGYNLAIAAGGALAGALHALVAPAVFTRVTEHPLSLALAVALLPSSQAPGDTQTRTRDVLVPLAVALLATGLRGVAPPDKSAALLVVGVPWALLLLASSGRRLRLALGFVALLCVRGTDPAVRFEARTFYGTVRVDEARGLRRMFHGSTLHGVSRTDQPPHPMAYYHPDTPIGALLARLAREAPAARVAVVGLGAGMLCAWAVPGQRWTFFELDPMVERVARRWFPYLSAARAPVEVVLGDARLALGERTGAFDLVVLDAFSSDAIPAHLLTREGLSVALRALRPGGRLAVHVTNRYLRMEGVLAATGRALGLRAWVRRGVVRDLTGGPVTTWVLLRRVDDLDGRPQDPGWAPLDPRGAPWTDDHHALGSVLRWR